MTSSKSGSTSDAGPSADAAWLCRGAEVLAALQLAVDRRSRRRGFRGRDEISGAMLLRPCRSVHTFGVRAPIDAAFCDGDGVVLDVITIAPGRISRPRWRSRFVVEARAGAFERWGIEVGDRLEVLTEAEA